MTRQQYGVAAHGLDFDASQLPPVEKPSSSIPRTFHEQQRPMALIEPVQLLKRAERGI